MASKSSGKSAAISNLYPRFDGTGDASHHRGAASFFAARSADER
jgi:hypothetical protein